MRETEFRINNLIKDRIGRVCYVEAIEYDKQEGYSIKAWPKKGGGQVSLPFEPIPLTEEILLKCGFEYDGDGIYGVDNVYYDFYFSKTGVVVRGLNNKIYHLHQLQNLYFALTGEELTIKL